MIGVFSDSYGDLDAFDRAYELLKSKGAKRFFFAGGRFDDLDAWIEKRTLDARGGRAYSDADFLADVSTFLSAQEQVERPPAFADEVAEGESWQKVKDRFLRVPEKDSLHYLDANVPRIAVDMIGDSLCCLVHDKNDLDRDDLLNGVVFVHGKSLEPKVVQIGPRYFLTPGKLTGAAEQTVGLIQHKEKSLTFSAFTLQDRVVVEPQHLSLERHTKLSVK